MTTNPTTTTTPVGVDRRLLAAGLGITVPLLISLWVDHYPAHTPIPQHCPGCGHDYVAGGPLCPTTAIVRPLLRRRRHQVPPDALLARMTYCQYQDLIGKTLDTDLVWAAARTRSTTAAADSSAEQLGLFTAPTSRGGAR